jgi:hypothetical protein
MKSWAMDTSLAAIASGFCDISCAPCGWGLWVVGCGSTTAKVLPAIKGLPLVSSTLHTSGHAAFHARHVQRVPSIAVICC